MLYPVFHNPEDDDTTCTPAVATATAALQQRKEQSGVIGKFMRDNNMDSDEKEKAVASAKALSNQAAEAAEQALATVQSTMDDLHDSLPNFLDDRVPEGKDDTENEIVSVWGDPSTHPAIAKKAWDDASSSDSTTEPLWHDDIAILKHGDL